MEYVTPESDRAVAIRDALHGHSAYGGIVPGIETDIVFVSLGGLAIFTSSNQDVIASSDPSSITRTSKRPVAWFTNPSNARRIHLISLCTVMIAVVKCFKVLHNVVV